MSMTSDLLEKSGLECALQEVERWVKHDYNMEMNTAIDSISWKGRKIETLRIKLRDAKGKNRHIALGLFEFKEYNPSEKKFYPLKQNEIESQIKDRIRISLRENISLRSRL